VPFRLARFDGGADRDAHSRAFRCHAQLRAGDRTLCRIRMATVTLMEKKQLISDFLTRCNHYADDQLRGYGAQLSAADGARALELQDKITHWTAYRVFNAYTIEELKTETLDHWFT
jgi:hypothetical protein